jgi:hypothetical protein
MPDHLRRDRRDSARKGVGHLINLAGVRTNEPLCCRLRSSKGQHKGVKFHHRNSLRRRPSVTGNMRRLSPVGVAALQRNNYIWTPETSEFDEPPSLARVAIETGTVQPSPPSTSERASIARNPAPVDAVPMCTNRTRIAACKFPSRRRASACSVLRSRKLLYATLSACWAFT